MSCYEEFVKSKLTLSQPCGFEPGPLPERLFPHQAALVRWAIRRGRAAVFAATGLGKTSVYLAWADAVRRHTGGNVLVLAPLAVVAQGCDEATALGLEMHACRSQADVRPGINATNYDRLHLFDPSQFVAVVLDESSCIKHHDAKTLQTLLDAFANTPYKLCCTATPAPNDWTELGTHAEFLGVCSRAEMLAEYFVHDGGETQTWRLKGHARAAFWRWVSSWGALVRSPADLGFDGSAYVLPDLVVKQHTLEADPESTKASGLLFAAPAATLMERRTARKGSLSARVKACADLVNATDETWIVWCDLNAESEALTKAIRGAVEIRGSNTSDEKELRLTDFSEGHTRVLVTKPSIAGFGLNWQHCHNVAFVGVTDSWEAYHQAVRRCWRFGQRKAVKVHIFASELEGAVIANLARKEKDAERMAQELSAETGESVRASVLGSRRETNSYEPLLPLRLPEWLYTKEEV